jgi:MFS family permease
MRVWALCILLLASASVPMLTSAQQPDLLQEHWYHSYTTLTADVNAWADDYPDIVDLTTAGQTELGKNLWVVRISDWSNDTKPDGTDKEIVYIDGGHHGNEHLGTELAFLTAEFYIEGWAAGEQEAIDVLTNTELHILIMLNADGNDLDTRWNINQVDLNRNYDHHWNEQDETQPGSGPFSEAETAANSNYMNTVVPNADLYVTMHTGVWIMLHPWGYIPDQPIDWEMFHFIRDDVHANISDIPIRNANEGLYPNSGTSRDYGYGIMGYPTFTFETDDEQWALGTVEALSDRLGEELEVMRYLIDNVWSWRARLEVQSITISDEEVTLDINNLGRATTANATLQYIDSAGDLVWNSSYFLVNATNSSKVVLDNFSGLKEGGVWQLHYQVRLVESSRWVSESVSSELVSGSVQTLSSMSSGVAAILQLSSLPFFLITGVWLWRRVRTLSESHGYEDGSDLPIIKTLCIAAAGIWTSAFSIASIMNYHSRILGASESLVILHIGVLTLGLGIGAVLSGYLADRTGKRTEILIACLLANISITVILPFLSLNAFILATSVQALLFGSFKLIFAIATELYPNSHGEAISLTWAFAYLASGSMSLIIGSVYELGGLIICLILSTIALLIALFASRSLKYFDTTMLTSKKRKSKKKSEKMKMKDSLKFKSPWILLILGAVLALSIPRGAVILPSVRYLEVIGVDVVFSSIFFGWAELAGIILLIYVGRLVDLFGPATTLVWAAIGYGVLWSVFAVGVSPFISVIIFIIPIYPFLVVSADSLMAEHSTTEERNRAMGLSTMVTLVGQAIGIGLSVTLLALLQGTAMNMVNQYRWAFRASIPLFAFAIWLCWTLYRKLGGDDIVGQLESDTTPLSVQG